jgi:hypothetical protein
MPEAFDSVLRNPEQVRSAEKRDRGDALAGQWCRRLTDRA